MRITSTNRPDGRHCVALTPEHSGEPNPPLRELLIDASILGTPGERQAAVAALAFGSYLRSVVATDVPISPVMAQALTSFQAPAYIAPVNVSVEGTQYTGAGSTLVLDLEHAGLVGRHSGDRGQVITLDVLPLTRWSGRLFSMDRLVTASNADLLGRSARGTARLGPYLAVALAFSHELHVSRIVVPSGDRSDEPWITRATDLLAATGVDLMTVDRSELHDLDLVEE